jgi:hypothetical protein
MHSQSLLYQFVLLPLVTFGGFSVMLCFVFLLPGVGNALAAIYTLVTMDWLNQKRLGGNNRIKE